MCAIKRQYTGDCRDIFCTLWWVQGMSMRLGVFCPIPCWWCWKAADHEVVRFHVPATESLLPIQLENQCPRLHYTLSCFINSWLLYTWWNQELHEPNFNQVTERDYRYPHALSTEPNGVCAAVETDGQRWRCPLLSTFGPFMYAFQVSWLFAPCNSYDSSYKKVFLAIARASLHAFRITHRYRSIISSRHHWNP